MTLDDTFLPIEYTAPPVQSDVIQLAAFQERSWVAGPGCRAVIWVAGCLRRCPGCIKPEFLSFQAGAPTAVEEVANRILAIKEIDGVTYSGGEPFEQSAALGNLSRRLKAFGLSIAAYSGYRLEALKSDCQRFGALLNELDLLIDGEYRLQDAKPQLWRGSANQTIHRLSPRMSRSPTPDRSIQEVQLSIADGTLRLTGFPDSEMEHRLIELLKTKGIELREAER